MVNHAAISVLVVVHTSGEASGSHVLRTCPTKPHVTIVDPFTMRCAPNNPDSKTRITSISFSIATKGVVPKVLAAVTTFPVCFGGTAPSRTSRATFVAHQHLLAAD